MKDPRVNFQSSEWLQACKAAVANCLLRYESSERPPSQVKHSRQRSAPMVYVRVRCVSASSENARRQ